MTIKDKRKKLEDQWKNAYNEIMTQKTQRKQTTNHTWQKGKKKAKDPHKTQKTHHNIGTNKKIDKKTLGQLGIICMGEFHNLKLEA
jgi:hypothetical protein